MDGSEELLEETIKLPHKFWKWFDTKRRRYSLRYPNEPESVVLKRAYEDYCNGRDR